METLIAIVFFILFGFVVGLVARALFPGPQWMGFFPTVGLGLLGSFVGGLLAALISGHGVFALHTSGFIGSVLGALVVLALARLAHRRAIA
jgi:uncharacterized membrane protein YeaQ/YmgE (transglycosylase-associated protein family)